MVGMNEDEESGKYLGKHEEIAEEPALTGRGDWAEISPQMIAVTFIVSEGIKHRAMLPVHAGLILHTETNFRDCPLHYYEALKLGNMSL